MRNCGGGDANFCFTGSRKLLVGKSKFTKTHDFILEFKINKKNF